MYQCTYCGLTSERSYTASQCHKSPVTSGHNLLPVPRPTTKSIEATSGKFILTYTGLQAHTERLESALRELIDCGKEMCDLMDDIRDGGYTPDSFTNQPMQTAIAKATAALVESEI